MRVMTVLSPVLALLFLPGLASAQNFFFSTPGASAGAASQFYYDYAPVGELIPPLRLTEEDFKQGFHKTFEFPNFPEDQRREGEFRRGTLSLTYTPGYVAPIRAVLSVSETHLYYENVDGKRVFLTVSIDWSGDLEPSDDDPEGKFPAQSFNFTGDAPGVHCLCPYCEQLPRPGLVVDLFLMERGVDGKLYRIPYVGINTFEACTCDEDEAAHEPGHPGIDLRLGPEPESPEDTEEKPLTLQGCTDLLKGGQGQLTAVAKSGAGTYTWSSNSSSVLSVSGSGDSASVSGKSPGRTEVRVEYETEDGETIEAEKAGSVVELRSVAAVPQIPLIDENGKELPPIQVSVVQDPPDGDLLTFAVADAGVATVLNLGSVLQIQGIREGTTTAQAQTVCGEKTGPVLNLEVVRCDETTVEKLRAKQRMIKARLDQGRKHMAEVTSNEEFNRADKEGPDEIADAAIKAAELISTTMGVAGGASTAVKVSKGAENADKVWGALNIMRDLATGIADGDLAKIDSAILDAHIQVAELTLLGAAKTAASAASAWSKLGLYPGDRHRRGRPHQGNPGCDGGILPPTG